MVDDKKSTEGSEHHDAVSPPLPPALAYIGIVVGLALAVIGLSMLILRGGTTSVAVLSTCVGFGIVLVAFGTQAGGKWAGFWATGAGGLAVGLYILLHNMPIGEDQHYVQGAIEESSSYGVVRIVGSEDLLVGRVGPADYRFAAFADDLNSDQAYVFATSGSSTMPDGTVYPPEFYIGCIPAALFKSRFGKSEKMVLSLQWNSEDKRFELIDLTGTTSVGYGVWSKKRCPKQAETASNWFSLEQIGKTIGGLFGSPASAQEMTNLNVDKWLKALESSDAIVRDDAREELSLVTDPAGIKQISLGWNVATSTYRADLGRLVSWTDAVAVQPEVSTPILKSLTPDQLTYVISLAGHPDSTMQGWATNFTTEMLTSSDAESQELVMAKAFDLLKSGDAIQWPVVAKAGVSQDYIYNTLFAFNEAKCALTPQNQIALASEIKTFSADYAGVYASPKVTSLAAAAQNTDNCG